MSGPLSYGKKSFETADGTIRWKRYRRTVGGHGLGDFGRERDQPSEEDAFQQLLTPHRPWNEMEPHSGPADRGDHSLVRRITDHGKGSVDLRLEPPITQEREQFAAREIAGAERARVEVGPFAVDRRYDETSWSGQNAPRLVNEPSGLGEVVECLVQEHDADAARSKGQRVRVEPHERDPAAIVPGSLGEKALGVISADNVPRPPREISEPGTSAARDFQNVAALGEPCGERVARIQHRKCLARDPVSAGLGDPGVIDHTRGRDAHPKNSRIDCTVMSTCSSVVSALIGNEMTSRQIRSVS